MANLIEILSSISDTFEKIGNASVIHSEAIVKIFDRIKSIEDRLDRLENTGKYRIPGPSPYQPRKPEWNLEVNKNR